MQIYIKDLGLLIGSLFFFIRLLHLPFSKKDCVRYGILVIFLMSWIPYLDRNHPHFILVTLPAIMDMLILWKRSRTVVADAVDVREVKCKCSQ